MQIRFNDTGTSQLRKSYTLWDKRMLLNYVRACVCGSMWHEQMKAFKN